MMTDKGAQPDRPDLAILPPAPALGRVRGIGSAQASITVGTGHQGERHRYHPPPILGRQ